ncbi:MAG: hypothetical protein N3F05_04110 [Candidatus Diapherotrites archaeon]|nr:hypothetical protein [Candidatus Diapherotrites archaeon]
MTSGVAKVKGIKLMILVFIIGMVLPAVSSNCNYQTAIDSCCFYINSKEKVEINGCGFLNLKINNFSHQDARITLTTEGADIDTTFYFVPAKTVVDKKLFVRVTSNNAKILLNANLGLCGNQTKEIRILNLSQIRMEPRKEPTQAGLEPLKADFITMPVLPNLELYYKLGERNNQVYVDATLRNASGQNVIGTLFADVPEGYRSSTHHVELAPFEEKSFRIWINSDGKKEKYSFDIVFAIAEFSFREKVYVEPKKEGTFAKIIGLFSLKDISIFLLIAILVIILLLLISGRKIKPRHKKRFEWE